MQIATFDRLVKVKRSLFGLPFTLAGGLFAFILCDAQVHWSLWIWIVTAFMAARCAGMAFNELIDRNIDRLNPRTAGRVLPSRDLSPRTAALIGWLGILIFLVACSQINLWVFLLSPLAALVILGYSYTKRFTSLCHFVLGLVHLMGPVMAWLAIGGEWGWPPILLGGTALCALVANDIVYALQDYRFDLQHGVHSIPVRVGPVGALMSARLLYSGAVVCLAGAGWVAEVSVLYYVGVVGALITVVHYDRVLLRRGEEGIPRAFFRCNTLVACCSLLGVVLLLF